jgi:hypothetical protein
MRRFLGQHRRPNIYGSEAFSSFGEQPQQDKKRLNSVGNQQMIGDFSTPN